MRMSKRLITALAVALALLVAAPALAIPPTPTAAPGEPPVNATAAVKEIYTDYRDDGVITICDHKRADLQTALDTIEPQFDTDYPDFREALQAGIQKWDKGKCVDTTPTATATATATATTSATATATATSTAESGELPPATGGGDGGGSGTTPPESGALPPTASATPAPSAVPTVPPATAAVTPSPTATPVTLTRSKSGSLLVPGIILGVVLLGAAALALSFFMAGRNPTWDHAWREASFRVRGTWADFSDWLKLGR